MPLLDHFRPPLYSERHWESFHAHWSVSIATALNRTVLPSLYFAEAQVHVGGRVEIDVATMEGLPEEREADGGGIAVATATEVVAAVAWAPPAPPLVFPAVFPDIFEVQVFRTRTGSQLVAAIEL